jgi:hypothetical protein
MIAASRLVWVDGELPYRGHVEVSGYDNAGDGAITLLVALITLAWGIRRAAFDSRQPVVVILPLAIGAASLLISGLAIQNALILIASWERLGGSGSISFGIWLTGLAALMLTVAGAVHLWRKRHETSFRFTLVPGDIGAAVGGIGGAIAGIIGSTLIAGRFFPHEQAAVYASAQVAILLPMLFIGAWLGSKVGRVIGEAFQPMPPGSSTRA